MEKLLRLGRVDENVRFSAADRETFLRLYHHPYGFAEGEIRFRDDSRNCWYAWEAVPGERIRHLTRFLQAAGFMPNATHDGIFGYVTQAAVRLFQEYVRTVDSPERHARRFPASWPDGVVGTATTTYIESWRERGTSARWSDGVPTPDYTRWINWLQAATKFYRTQPTPLMQRITAAERRGDSLPPTEWTYEPADTHLIGIRRRVGTATEVRGRAPDDLFVLLIGGKSFYFWGSTDANPSSGREGYLTEGQHRYRLNWHNIGARRRDRIYKAARPAGEGVLVVRDVHGHNALTPENRRDGFDPAPNPTFNIHWSGLGSSNWSAGCQVVSGKNYFNDAGQLISCADYAARNDAQRGQRRTEGGPRLTMGAYTVLSDLVLCYTRQPESTKKPTFLYSLFQEEAFGAIGGIDRREIEARVQDLRTEAYY